MATTPRKSAEAEESKTETPAATRLTASEGLPADALADDSAVAATQKAVKAAMDRDTEQGFRGTAVDPTPNENYTLAGVTDPSKHTPEEFKTQTGVTVYPSVHPDAAK